MKTKILSVAAVFLLICILVNTHKISKLSSRLDSELASALIQAEKKQCLEDTVKMMRSIVFDISKKAHLNGGYIDVFLLKMQPDSAVTKMQREMISDYAVLYGKEKDELIKKLDYKELQETKEQPKSEKPKSNEKGWVQLYYYKGKQGFKTENFTYHGGKARIRYDYKAGAYMGFFTLSIVPEWASHGSLELMLTESTSGESNLSHLDAGTYYLDITNANGMYEFIIEELR